MKKSIIIAIIFQIFILLSLLLYAYLPLYFGKEIQVRASGHDPRDLFLGNFTALSYEIGQVKTKIKYKKNQIIYLTLKPNKDFYTAHALKETRPKQGLYLQGRVRYSYDYEPTLEGEKRYNTLLKFGIEKYFTTKKSATLLEEALREKNATITLGVIFGIPRIKSVQIDN